MAGTILMAIIALLIIVFGVIGIPAIRERQKQIKKTGKYPKGY